MYHEFMNNPKIDCKYIDLNSINIDFCEGNTSNMSNTKHNTYKYIRKLNNHTIHKFKCSINAFNWKYIYSDMDLELLYDNKLINDLVELFNLNYPIIKLKIINRGYKIV